MTIWLLGSKVSKTAGQLLTLELLNSYHLNVWLVPGSQSWPIFKPQSRCEHQLDKKSNHFFSSFFVVIFFMFVFPPSEKHVLFLKRYRSSRPQRSTAVPWQSCCGAPMMRLHGWLAMLGHSVTWQGGTKTYKKHVLYKGTLFEGASPKRSLFWKSPVGSWESSERQRLRFRRLRDVSGTPCGRPHVGTHILDLCHSCVGDTEKRPWIAVWRCLCKSPAWSQRSKGHRSRLSAEKWVTTDCWGTWNQKADIPSYCRKDVLWGFEFKPFLLSFGGLADAFAGANGFLLCLDSTATALQRAWCNLEWYAPWVLTLTEMFFECFRLFRLIGVLLDGS